MQRSDKPWAAAVAAARANKTFVRVSPRESPRNHQSDHPPTWVAVPNRQSMEAAQVPKPLRKNVLKK